MSEEAAAVIETIERDGEITTRPASRFGVELLGALHKARAAFKAVARSGHNKFDRYDYPTLQDFIDAVDEALLSNDLLLICEQVEVAYFKTPSDAMPNGARVRVRGELYHVPTGQVKIHHQTAHSFDKGDKAEFKANTGARKYLVADLLHIHTGDDPEKDSVPDHAPQQREDRQQPATAAPPANGANKKPGSEVIIAAIGKIGNAAGLAKYLSERMGETPVAKAPNGWSKILTAATTRLNGAQWTPEQKATVDAVLAAIRNELATLKPSATPTSTKYKAPEQTPTSLASLQSQVDAMLTPGDLFTFLQMMATGDRAAAVAARSDAKLWHAFTSHAAESIHERMERGDGGWTLADCEAVGALATDLKAKAELDSQATEAFGGTN